VGQRKNRNRPSSIRSDVTARVLVANERLRATLAASHPARGDFWASQFEIPLLLRPAPARKKPAALRRPCPQRKSGIRGHGDVRDNIKDLTHVPISLSMSVRLNPPLIYSGAQVQLLTHLPTDVRGVERVDDRRVISGIVHVLTRIMHHAALFCTSGELTRADVPSGGIGVRQLGMQRVRG
jgi:hypothetical protein